jgi:hypothetical protein
MFKQEQYTPNTAAEGKEQSTPSRQSRSHARCYVAIKAIFLLWKRARWEALEQLFIGVPRWEIDRGFQAFDETQSRLMIG